MYIPVEGDPSLVRDDKNNSIINIDKSGYQSYIAKRDKELSEKDKIKSLESKVESLQNDIGDIKDLLRKALDK